MIGALRLPALALAALACGSLAPPPPTIGVYYYGGWHEDPAGWGHKKPWDAIRPFPEREPSQGWYDGADRRVIARQGIEMARAGIGFVAFDWFYEDGGVQIDQPLRIYQSLRTPRPRYTLLWANHGGHTTAAGWRTIVDVWATRYFRDPRYFRIDGRVVVFVFSGQRLSDDAAAAGTNLRAWLAEAQATMRARGLPPVYFVAGVVGGDEPILRTAKADGFAAVSAYNLRNGPGDAQMAHGYPALDDAYRRQWASMVKRRTGLDVIAPMTSGWDRRPWGGSKDPGMDHSMSTVSQFRAHLAAGRAFMRDNGLGTGVICCWNEYGEGSVIEPLKSDSGGHLAAVRDTFAPPARRR